ncbi:HAD family hydrolase [Primorskyibacter sp. S187A]|uniref:HAD family hydrolase n=1 Tax=Primorskyibacter sp. S187A TaxID=3415130 RepID=UPI003C79FA5E
MDVAGIVFDKDGTLIDFSGTWDRFAQDLIEELSGGATELAARLADAMDFDLAAGTFRATSRIIAGTSREAAECVQSALPDRSLDEVENLMAERAAVAQMAPVVPLGPYCAGLKAAGFKLGVATNDSEAVAQANLRTLGLTGVFDFVAGYDSGFGGKPDAGMLTAFANAMALAPQTCVMVGDSPHDLIAAQRAGFRSVGVLTGVCDHDTLAPLCEVVLSDIGHLPNWLGLKPAP